MRRVVLVLLVLLLVLNLLVFFYRDHFQYHPYSGYTELYGECDAGCRRKWTSFAGAYDSSELRAARRIIRDSLHFSPTATAEEKVVALSDMIMRIFLKKHGLPSETFLRQTPLQQYENLCLRDSGRLWCGNLAQIFSFFCSAEGIVTRNIEIRNPGDHHVVNECYLPEIKQWVLMDIPHEVVLMKDHSGKFLDLQTFRKSILSGVPVYYSRKRQGNEAKPFHISGLYFEHFYRGDHPHYYYHELNAKRIYSAGNKISRYFLPLSWYEIYSEREVSNWKFHVRQALFVLFLLLLLASGFLFIKGKRSET